MSLLYTSFDNFIIKHQLELTIDDWNDISRKYELSIDMMRMFQNKINWRYIAEYQNLSISFIREFIEYQLGPYMEVICKYQYLDEDFIRNYKNKVDWDLILKHQHLSMGFILDHAQEIKKFQGKDTVE